MGAGRQGVSVAPPSLAEEAASGSRRESGRPIGDDAALSNTKVAPLTASVGLGGNTEPFSRARTACKSSNSRSNPTGEGYHEGYWPGAVCKAASRVFAGRRVANRVGVSVGWEVPEPLPEMRERVSAKRVKEVVPSGYPDQGLFSMLEEGCATGYRGPASSVLIPNSRSVIPHEEKISARIALEMKKGRMEVQELGGARVVTPLAMIPKPFPSTKKRMIRDLSRPAGKSINDGITELPVLELPQVEDVLQLVQDWRAAGVKRVGIRRVDADAAYRRVGVRRADRWQLGLQWKGRVLRDTVLPMGLRSSCHLYQRLTCAIIWTLCMRGITAVGYLDDILLVGPLELVDEWADYTKNLLDYIQLDHSADKFASDGPAAEVSMALGYKVDLVKNKISVPDDKLKRLRRALRRILRASCLRRNEVSQMVGWLGHLVRVVPAMRVWCGGFYRQLGAFASRTDKRWVRISSGAKEAARRWTAWLRASEGGSLFALWSCSGAATVYSDASEWGGGFWSPQLRLGAWWQWSKVWPGYLPKQLHINILEAVAAVTALWWCRRGITGRVVTCRVDSQVVLGALRRGYSPVEALQASVCRWGEVLALSQGEAIVRLDWVSSKSNFIADALSRPPPASAQDDWRSLLDKHAQVSQLQAGTWFRSWTLRLGGA